MLSAVGRPAQLSSANEYMDDKNRRCRGGIIARPRALALRCLRETWLIVRLNRLVSGGGTRGMGRSGVVAKPLGDIYS